MFCDTKTYLPITNITGIISHEQDQTKLHIKNFDFYIYEVNIRGHNDARMFWVATRVLLCN